MFEKDVKYAIVLATTHVVRMMALTTDDQNQFSLKDTAFQVNTDDIVMLAITGLENGQIFLGGRDGNMYELEYEVCHRHSFSSHSLLFLCARLKNPGFGDVVL